MTNNSYARTAAGMFDTINRRLTSVERRLPPLLEPYVPPQTAGSATARDAYFGVPTTDAQRVALANQSVLWFNTDNGWQESYYAVTGLSGLTATGLVAGTASGWYPIGLGPYILMKPTATFAAATGTNVRGWNGTTARNGGTAWFTYDNATGAITVVKAGRYRVFARTSQINGTGTANYHLYLGAVLIGDNPVTLNSTLTTPAFVSVESEPIAAGTAVTFYTFSGTLTVHVGGDRGEFAVRYLGPALVSN